MLITREFEEWSDIDISWDVLVCIKDVCIVDSSTKNDIVETENCDDIYTLKCDSKKGEMSVLLS